VTEGIPPDGQASWNRWTSLEYAPRLADSNPSKTPGEPRFFASADAGEYDSLHGCRHPMI
jgi:hypothetical protein